MTKEELRELLHEVLNEYHDPATRSCVICSAMVSARGESGHYREHHPGWFEVSMEISKLHATALNRFYGSIGGVFQVFHGLYNTPQNWSREWTPLEAAKWWVDLALRYDGYSLTAKSLIEIWEAGPDAVNPKTVVRTIRVEKEVN